MRRVSEGRAEKHSERDDRRREPEDAEASGVIPAIEDDADDHADQRQEDREHVSREGEVSVAV